MSTESDEPCRPPPRRKVRRRPAADAPAAWRPSRSFRRAGLAGAAARALDRSGAPAPNVSTPPAPAPPPRYRHGRRRCRDRGHRRLGADHGAARAHPARGRPHRSPSAAGPDLGGRSRRRPRDRPADQRSRGQGRRLHVRAGLGASPRTSRPAARRSRRCAPSPTRSTCSAAACCPRSSPPRGELDPSTLRASDGAIDLARIAAVAPTLVQADSAMSRATAAVAARPASTWLGPVDSARGDLLAQMRSLGKTLHSADPRLAGSPRRCWAPTAPSATSSPSRTTPRRAAPVACPARSPSSAPPTARSASSGSRATARWPGSRAASNFGPDYNRLWSVGAPYNEYVDSNVSPHFPYAARIWLAMWQTKTARAARRRARGRPAGAGLPARGHRSGDAARPFDRVGGQRRPADPADAVQPVSERRAVAARKTLPAGRRAGGEHAR